MVQRKNYNLHLMKRKNSDDRFKDDRTEVSGRATQHAQATWVIRVHTKMNLPLFLQLRVTLHLYKRTQQTETSVPETSHECIHIIWEDSTVTSKR